MRSVLCLALVTLAFAGCIGDGQDVDDVATPPLPLVDLSGRVLTPNFNPIDGATVSFSTPDAVYVDGTTGPGRIAHNLTTDAEGNFSVASVPGSFTATVSHADYQDRDVVVTAPDRNVTITLQPALVDLPYNEAFDFDGTIQCAAEYVIITPSCDTLLGYPHEQNDANPDVSIFQDDSVFEITTPTGWQSIVLDISYDGSSHPGIAGLRTSAYAAEADAEVFSYERIDQKWAPSSFTFRIDAGTDYGDAVPAPDSDGGDGIRFEFFPQGHADDTVCVPADSGLPEQGRCFLGVGLAQDVTFTATATIFVHEPAPQGWTRFANA